jgi:hypothetical protein
MKNLSLFICSIFVLCFFNLATLQAEDPINDTTQQATVSIYIYAGPFGWYKFRTPYTGMTVTYGSLSDDSDDINKQEATPASSPSTTEN